MSSSVIVAGARTPVGRVIGGLAALSAAELGGTGVAGLCGGGQGEALLIQVPKS